MDPRLRGDDGRRDRGFGGCEAGPRRVAPLARSQFTGSPPIPHFLLQYDLAPDYLDRRPIHRDLHLGLAWAAAERGELLLGGALEEPDDTALLLFGTRAAAEAFAAEDPYVAHGLVTGWRVRPWRTVVGDGAAEPVRVG